MMLTAYPLKRDLDALRGHVYDLLVVGGGIYGAWIACDAAQRGLSVALIERDDWGAGTSSASSKLIHGGLRYLERLQFALVREALRERRTLCRIAPHLVHPLRFAVPVWRGDRVGPRKLRAGLALYDLLAGDAAPVGRHQRLTAEAALRQFPLLRGEGLQAVLSYGDCQEDDARLTLNVVAAAQLHGVRVANRVAAEAVVDNALGQLSAVRVRDRVRDEVFELPAQCVVNASGPWASQLAGTFSDPPRLIQGVHLLMPALPGVDHGLLLSAPQDGRPFFVIPWYGRTLLGTTESELESPQQARVRQQDVHYLIDAVNHAMPALGWTVDHVISAYVGVRALQARAGASMHANTREFEVMELRPGLLQPLGGKYTTARADAARVVERVFAGLRRRAPPCQTDRSPLPGAPLADSDLQPSLTQLQQLGVDDESRRWLAQRHGTRIAQLLPLLRRDRSLTRRLDEALPLIRGEVVLCATDEMVMSLSDLLRRRLPLLLLSRPAREVLDDACALCAQALGWSLEFRQRQLAELELELARQPRWS